VGKAFWPTRLAVIYPHPWKPLPWLQVSLAILFLAAVSALVIVARRRRYLLVGWLWFLGTLVPMIGLVHVGNQAMADRYAYLPFIGIFIMVCWGVADIIEERHLPAVLLPAVSVVVLLALAVVTYRQVGYWSDSKTLWIHALEVTDDNYIAHDNLALALMDDAQPDEAIKHFQAALAIFPSDPTSNLRIAVYDHQHGNLQQAVERYDHMLSITPTDRERSALLSNRGLVYVDEHENLRAQQDFQAAVAADPHNYRGWLGLGVVAQRSGNLDLAIQNYQRANAAKPTVIVCQLLATVLDQAGRKQEAQAARDRAKLLSPAQRPSQSLTEGLLAQ
jgi:tetratricopeptide (TPR) repeat protein